MHGRGIDGGRDVHEPQVAGAARERQVAHVADQRDVGVVDGDRELGLIVERRRQVLAFADGASSIVAGPASTTGWRIRPKEESAGGDSEDGEITCEQTLEPPCP